MVDKINKNRLNFSFKCLEGIVKADAEAPDMEEAEEVVTE